MIIYNFNRQLKEFMQTFKDCDIKIECITCFLCDTVSSEPRLCPKCAKCFCNKCLLLYFKSECLSCETKLQQSEYLRSETVFSIVNSIVDQVKKTIKKNEDKQMCEDHQLPLRYYCTECNHALCADCGLLSPKHFGHKFLSYRDIYQQIKKKVYKQFPRFDKKIKVLQQRKFSLNNKLQNLHDDYRRNKKQFQEAYISYMQKVELKGKEQEKTITVKLQSNLKRLYELQHLRDSIHDEIEKKSPLNLIKQSSTLAESISSLANHQSINLKHNYTHHTNDIQDLAPQYTVWTYSLQHFHQQDNIVYSDGKIFNGIQWRLKVYPRGNGLAKQKYISVFVEMTKALTNQNKYEYKIEMINPVDQSLSIKRQYCSTFQIGECWGYNQFFLLEQLEIKEFLDKDALLFRFGIKNKSYKSLVDDQNLYIKDLQRKISQKERQKLTSSSIKSKKIKFVHKSDRLSQGESSEMPKDIKLDDQQQKYAFTSFISSANNESQSENISTYQLLQSFLKKDVSYT